MSKELSTEVSLTIFLPGSQKSVTIPFFISREDQQVIGLELTIGQSQETKRYHLQFEYTKEKLELSAVTSLG